MHSSVRGPTLYSASTSPHQVPRALLSSHFHAIQQFCSTSNHRYKFLITPAATLQAPQFLRFTSMCAHDCERNIEVGANSHWPRPALLKTCPCAPHSHQIAAPPCRWSHTQSGDCIAVSYITSAQHNCALGFVDSLEHETDKTKTSEHRV